MATRKNNPQNNNGYNWPEYMSNSGVSVDNETGYVSSLFGMPRSRVSNAELNAERELIAKSQHEPVEEARIRYRKQKENYKKSEEEARLRQERINKNKKGGKKKKKQKIHVGPRGGKYIIKKGKKVYL